MTDLMRDRIEALKQVQPSYYNGTDEEILSQMTHDECARLGIEHPYLFGIDESIESIERAYDRGYDAIINDGKLIGFKKAV